MRKNKKTQQNTKIGQNQTAEKAAEKPVSYVAIDISKDNLQVQTCKGETFSCANDRKGIARLISRLKKMDHPVVVCEASGGYERLLMEELFESGIGVCLVGADLVRNFAKSYGLKAKTDPIDTNLIYKYAIKMEPRLSKKPTEAMRKLAALMDRRTQLKEELVREKNRLEKSTKWVRESIELRISQLQAHIVQIELEIESTVASDDDLQSKADALQEVDGIGRITAWTILAYLPEIGTLSRNEIVAMVGVAPYNRDSGRMVGKRCIQGGRAKVRSCLYMAAVSAITCNHVIKPYYARLIEKGKKGNCAIVACIRKLVIHLNSIIARLIQKAA